MAYPGTSLFHGETSSLSNGIFVGGWYSLTTKFSMTSGTSGVYIAPPVSSGFEIICPPDLTVNCDNRTDPGATGVATASDMCPKSVDCHKVPSPASECTPPALWDFDKTINGQVDWNSLGLGSPENVTSRIRLQGTGTVIIENNNLILKSSNAILYVSGVELIVKNGNIQLESSGSRFLMEEGVLRTSGNFQQKPFTIVCIEGSIVDIGEEEAGVDFVPGVKSTSADFQNDGGYRYISNVCMNVTHDVQLQSTGSGSGLNGVDIWVNSCVEVGDRGLTHATPTPFGVSDGDDSGNWQNSNNQTIGCTDIIIANGNFQTSNNILTMYDVDVKLNKSGNFQVNSGILAGEGLCVAVEDVFENSGQWTLTGIKWYSEKQNSTNVPGAGKESEKQVLLNECLVIVPAQGEAVKIH